MSRQGSSPSNVSSAVYVSNAEDGEIGTYLLLPDGALVPSARVKVGTIVGPLAVSSNGRFLYAATRAEPFTVHVFSIEQGTGALRPVSVSPLPASFPYITVDASGRYLLGASYGGSVIAVNRIGDDRRVAAKPLQVLPLERNAHAIRVDATNRFVYVPALGTDRLYQFRFDAPTGTLTPNDPPWVDVVPGSGPRHLAFSADGRFIYLLNEMTATVTVFAVDADTGTARVVGTTSTLPPDTPLVPGRARGPAVAPDAAPRDASRDAWAAEIHLTPDGRFVFTTERTSNTLSALRVNFETGALTYVGSTPTETQPRGFAIDPTGRFLVACGEKSGMVSLYAINSVSGGLKLLGQYPGGKGANWVSIVKLS